MSFLEDYSNLPRLLLNKVSNLNDSLIMPLSCKTDVSDEDPPPCNFDRCLTDDCKIDTCDDCYDSGCGNDEPCSIDVCALDNVCDDCDDTPVPRPSGNGQITLVSKSKTSVTINLKEIDYATTYHIVYRLASNTTVIDRIDTTNTRNITISGLSPGTKYAINYQGVNSSGNNGYMSSPFEVTTLFDIQKWNWDISNGDASRSETQNAYYAVIRKDKTTNFSYKVWNDLVEKVAEVLEADNLEWNNRFASFYGTKMSALNKTLTASRFNSLRYNIGLHYSTGIDTVSKGDIVYGHYFTTLTNCINSWIDTLGG